MKSNSSFIPKSVKLMVLMIISLGISGCAATNPTLYRVNIRYDAAQTVIPEYLKANENTRSNLIAVAEFTDTRQVDEKEIIGHVRERDDSKVSIFPKDVMPAKAVADGIKEYLHKADYKVADKIVRWDLNEANIPDGNGKVIIGGSIDKMQITCWTGAFSNSYKTRVNLTIVLADAAKRKIIYKSKVESSSSRDDVSFSEEEIGGQLSAALGDAIKKVFEDENLAQKIKEAMTPKE